MIPFGRTASGEDVHKIVLSGHGLTASALTYGAILQDLRLEGVAHSLTFGAERLEDYETLLPFHGAVVGPIANRIGNGRAEIEGFEYQLERNQNGLHTLHSGTSAAHNRVWKIDGCDSDRAILYLDMPDGDCGLPGNRRLEARFEILPEATLQLTLTTTTDAPSLANATNHSYWNLDGSASFTGHEMKIDAAEYLPSDAETLPTGEIAAVDGTAFDFRNGRSTIAGELPLDTTFCVARDRGPLTERLWLRGMSGVSMTVSTTETGVHVYDDRPNHQGLAVECQGWPDAPNRWNFPSIEVTPDAPLVQVTRWAFSRKGNGH